MELIIALALFVTLVSSWLVLPGSAPKVHTAAEKTEREAQADVLGVVGQAA